MEFEKEIPYELPSFRGYTVDIRLKQFRKVIHPDKGIEFIDFDSEEGEELLDEMWQYFKDLFWG